MKFDFRNSFIDKHTSKVQSGRLLPEIARMNRALRSGYRDARASINLPSDRTFINQVEKLVGRIEKPDAIVVCGIGGSNLGTVAVTEAVLGKYHQQKNDKKIFFVDTVDSDSVNDVARIVEGMLKNGKKVILNGVSKSGGTTETIANFEIFVQLLKKYRLDFRECIVVTTDRDSRFWNLGRKEGFHLLEIPKKVGGRYSVFSNVGLFPLRVIGVDIRALLKGALLMRKRCLSKKNNPAAASAIAQFVHYSFNKKNISDLFLFSNDLESVGKWYRQLMGESVGKEFNRAGRRVFCGMTPTVSIGSTDLHSMAQLYLGGPYDKFTTFVTVKKNRANIKVPDIPKYSALVKGIQGRPLARIMDAILQGVKLAFAKQKRPFCEITLPDKKEASIGALLQFKMMEMMYLGYLLGVNPFDQPNVEAYKVETKKILK